MARALNRFTIIGNVGQSIDFGVLPSGDPVANFSVAVNEKWTDKSTNNLVERVDWFRCSVKGSLVSVVEQYVRSGSQLFIEGNIRTGSYERNGETIPTFEVNVTYLNVLTFVDDAQQQPARPQQKPQQNNAQRQLQPQGYQQHPQQQGYQQRTQQQGFQPQSRHQPRQQRGQGQGGFNQ